MPDDDEKADHKWLTGRGWDHFDFGNYMFEVRGGFCEKDGRFQRWWVGVLIEQAQQTFEISGEEGFSQTVPCPCRTRGEVRRIEAVFNLPVKE